MLSFKHIKEKHNGIFAIHGGGNIGLGVMADVASRSSFNYRIVATSNDEFLKKIVNSTQQLWLQHTGSSKVTHIENVTIISRNFSDIVKLYKEASILAICLTPAAMKSSVKAIAQGLIERHKTKHKDLKVLVLMNLPDCDKIVREAVTQEINALIHDPSEAKKVCDSVKFIPTVVDRIVTKVSEKEIKNQLKHHLLSCISMDFIDKQWLKQKITALLDRPDQLAIAINKFNLRINLFKAEKNFALYAPSQVTEISQFPAIKPVKDLKQLEAIKNKYINGPHAIIAWLGSLFGCKTIASAINYPGMQTFIENIMDKEIAPVLMKEYPELTNTDLINLKKLFFERCQQSIDDPVERVGRDPLRKINAGERLRGILELQQHHDLNIPMSGLIYGIAAAILYAVKQSDPSNAECKKIHEIYSDRKSYKDVLSYRGVYSSGMFSGLNENRDKTLIIDILNKIAILERILEMQKVSAQPLSLLSKSVISTTQVIQQLCIHPAEIGSPKNLTLLKEKPLSYADVLKQTITDCHHDDNIILTSLSSRHSTYIPSYGR